MTPKTTTSLSSGKNSLEIRTFLVLASASLDLRDCNSKEIRLSMLHTFAFRTAVLSYILSSPPLSLQVLGISLAQ